MGIITPTDRKSDYFAKPVWEMKKKFHEVQEIQSFQKEERRFIQNQMAKEIILQESSLVSSARQREANFNELSGLPDLSQFDSFRPLSQRANFINVS
jgi:hypothetical protein